MLCDLNWVRLVQQRVALAQFFDFPAMHDQLAQITNVEIDFAPGYRTDQIGWYVPAVPDEQGMGYYWYTTVPPEGCEWWDRLPSLPAKEPSR